MKTKTADSYQRWSVAGTQTGRGLLSGGGRVRELVWRSQHLNRALREEGIWGTQKREMGGGHSRLT